MKHEIIGGAYPALKCTLNKGEIIRCEGGGMSWMSDGFNMKTEGGGSLGKALGRSFGGEAVFFNAYEAKEDNAEITFAASWPGRIVAIPIKEGMSVIAQKSTFLACTSGVDVRVHFRPKVGVGIFGGLGFIMQKFTGNGIVFLEIHGGIEEKTLAPGERIKVDAPHVAMMSEQCSMDIEKIKGVKNVVFGGEGLFNTVITGPGKVWLQTLPVEKIPVRVSSGGVDAA